MESRELENYLTRLEKALGPIAVSEKAEIITEIKSHVMDALSYSPNKTVTDILSSLGEPEQVANKYLLERGLGPQKPPRHPIVKWLVIGFLGTFSIVILSFFILIWKFTPLISVDEANGRVQLLGGVIDVNSDKGIINIADTMRGRDRFDSTFKGSEDLKAKKVKQVVFEFSNIKLSLKNGDDNYLRYDCQLNGQADKKEEIRDFKLNFKKASNARCEVVVPKNVDLKIKAQNAKFEFDKLENNLKVEAMNASVFFDPSDDIDYRYDLSVMNGKLGNFESSKSSTAYKIDIALMNGKITN